MIGKMFHAMTIALTAFLGGSVDAQALDGKFRGMYVCSKLPTTRDILRVPIDLVVHDNSVQFARPLFNLNGTRVVGTELAAGTIDDNGTVHLRSDWSFLGNTAEANYTGTISAAGGTLTGNQNWKGQDGQSQLSRPCAAAFVPAPQSSNAPQTDDSDANSSGDEP
jgi:hypothetical protein